jgi:hypothetical protein
MGFLGFGFFKVIEAAFLWPILVAQEQESIDLGASN